MFKKAKPPDLYQLKAGRSWKSAVNSAFAGRDKAGSAAFRAIDRRRTESGKGPARRITDPAGGNSGACRVSAVFGSYFRSMVFLAASTMCSAVRRYSFRRNASVPTWPKRSSVPTISMGTGTVFAAASATAEPRPP